MRLKIIIITVITTLFSFSSTVYACSCSNNLLISEQVGSTPLIFEGRAISTTPDDTVGKFNNAVTTFDVSKMWRGDQQTQIEVIHKSGPGPACGIGFSTDKKSLILAYPQKDGRYETNACAKGYGFSDDQFKDYLEIGTEAYHLSSACYRDISSAYQNSLFVRKFELEDPRCLNVKYLYDQKNPISPDSEYMDGKLVDPLARHWADSRWKYSCRWQMNRSLDYLENTPSQLLNQLDEDFETADSTQFARLARNTATKFIADMDNDSRLRLSGYLYLQAAKRGDAGSMSKIGWAFISCRHGLTQNTKSAMHWYTKAKRAGDARANLGLASLYLAGMTDALDPEKSALELLEACKGLKKRSCRREYDWLKEAIDRR